MNLCVLAPLREKIRIRKRDISCKGAEDAKIEYEMRKNGDERRGLCELSVLGGIKSDSEKETPLAKERRRKGSEDLFMVIFVKSS
jgi:hypothetical protein